MNRYGEKRLQVFDRNVLVIFELKALGAVGQNGNDARTERRTAPRLLDTALAHLQQSGINGLLFGFVVDLARALAFQDDGGDASWAVPHGEIADRGPAWQRKNVVSLFDGPGVIAENLAHGNPRH